MDKSRAPVTPVVQAQGLCKNFGDTTLLRGIDFDITSGQCFGLHGTCGAGKTIRIATRYIEGAEYLCDSVSCAKTGRSGKRFCDIIRS